MTATTTTVKAQARWRFSRTERNALALCGTGDYHLDGIPLAFGGDPAGTARASLDGINASRAALGLPAVVITNTVLSTAGAR